MTSNITTNAKRSLPPCRVACPTNPITLEHFNMEAVVAQVKALLQEVKA